MRAYPVASHIFLRFPLGREGGNVGADQEGYPFANHQRNESRGQAIHRLPFRRHALKEVLQKKLTLVFQLFAHCQI